MLPRAEDAEATLLQGIGKLCPRKTPEKEDRRVLGDGVLDNQSAAQKPVLNTESTQTRPGEPVATHEEDKEYADLNAILIDGDPCEGKSGVVGEPEARTDADAALLGKGCH